MSFYKNNSTLKMLLAAMGILIVTISMFYSNYIAKQLEEREKSTVTLFVQAVILVSKDTQSKTENEKGREMELAILSTFNGIMPIILEDELGDLKGYNYPDEENNNNQEFLSQRKAKLINSGFVPINGYGSSKRIFYEPSRLYKFIKYFPLAQVLLLGTFILFGYYFLLSTRRSEENRIWAGMAKETAHQLGTPISAIIGWIEHLKLISNGNPEHNEVVVELQKDVDRLELIADRFSKIGSTPDLEKINIVEELEGSMHYMQRRAAKKVVFDFPSGKELKFYCNINVHLFNWVIENLLRNSLDAMNGKGKISADVFTENNMVHIELTDTGKGIPASQFKTIFKPGFTTKKRGWGLGLSLAKRIVENYHNGKIFVKNSKSDEGTTFAILLPMA
jgi:signal transduction histidine kinase